MSAHPVSHAGPSLANDGGSRRASCESEHSARTWIPSPHKAPLLEPVLNTIPVTRSPSHTGPSNSFEDVEQMSVHIDGPDRESILGSRKAEAKETKKGFAGNLLSGLRRLPEVVGVFGADRKKSAHGDAADAAPAHSPPVIDENPNHAQAPDRHDVTDYDTAEDDHVGPLPDFPTPFTQPISERFQHSSSANFTHPLYVHNREYHKGYDLSADAEPTRNPHDVQGYDYAFHHHQSYHPQEPQMHVHYGTVFNQPRTGDYPGRNPRPLPVPDPAYRLRGERSVNLNSTDVPEPVIPLIGAMPRDHDARITSLSTNPAQTTNRSRPKIVRFLKCLYRLPWISSRITTDYEPTGKIVHRPTPANIDSSWYTPRRFSLDLLSSGESLHTIPGTHRHNQTILSVIGSSSLQTETQERHHRSQEGRKKTARRTSLPRRRDPSRSDRVQPSAENMASPTIRGLRLDGSGHRGQRTTETKANQHTAGRSDQKHKSRRRTHDPQSASHHDHSHNYPRYPQMMAAVPYVPSLQPLFIVTPQAIPQLSSDQSGLRHAVPVYVLAPPSPSVVLSPRSPVEMPVPEPTGIRTSFHIPE